MVSFQKDKKMKAEDKVQVMNTPSKKTALKAKKEEEKISKSISACEEGLDPLGRVQGQPFPPIKVCGSHRIKIKSRPAVK